MAGERKLRLHIAHLGAMLDFHIRPDLPMIMDRDVVNINNEVAPCPTKSQPVPLEGQGVPDNLFPMRTPIQDRGE